MFHALKSNQPQSNWSDLARIQTRPIFYACPGYLQCDKDPTVWRRSDEQWRRYHVHNIFSALKNKYYVLVNHVGLRSLMKSMAKLTERLDLTIAIDWDVKLQNNNNIKSK